MHHYWTRGTSDETRNSQSRYQLSNHLDSVALELNDNAEIVTYEEYLPFGGTALIAGKTAREVTEKEYRYSGKERDDSTGLYYYGARYYAPWLLRWINPDPAGTVDGLNLYQFVKGNPIKLVDAGGFANYDILKTKFEYDRGDLVYGLDKPRAQYIAKDKKSILGYSKHKITVNFYTSEALAILATESNKAQGMKANNARQRGYFQEGLKLTRPTINLDTATSKEYWKNKTEGNQPLPEGRREIFREYLTKSITDPKKDNRDFIKLFESTKGQEQEDNKDNFWVTTGVGTDAIWHPWAIWKESSKIGLDVVINSKSDAKIHFVLDGLDIDTVIEKKGLEGHSVTASELRFLYRNKDKLNGKVAFYNEGKEVAAPWVDNATQWERYTPKPQAANDNNQSNNRNPLRMVG